jgi:RND family efflux transporter MFP subunit
MTPSAHVGRTFLLTTCIALGACRPTQASPAEPPADAIHVETAEVREEPMPRSLRLTGTLRAGQRTELAANAAGRVVRTLVERGSEVKQGDTLAVLDTRSATLSAAEARAQAEQAVAQAESAKRECQRYKALLDKGAITQLEYDRQFDSCRTAGHSLDAARTRAAEAALVVGDGAIRAPFAGVIGERYVQVGEYVRQDSRVVSLAALDQIKLELTVPEASVAAVKKGGTVTFTVPAYPGRFFSGTVRFISGSLRESTRDIVAEAVVDNADRALRPNMFASVALSTGDAPTPVLPTSAIVVKEGLSHVFVVVAQRAEERVVQTDARRGDRVAVLRGIKLGDRVVVSPPPALRNGQAVN